MRVAIVGGGISGLALAYALRDRADVVVLEASDRLGGNVRTTIKDGFVLDHAGDSWVASKPAAKDLAVALGLGDRLIETVAENRRVYVVARNGELVPLPRGLVLGVPTRVRPFLSTPLISWRGKLRAALDLILPAGFGRGADGADARDDDESVARWFERRLGREIVDALASPLLGGLYTGDVHALSLQASFPQLAALEKRGSVIRAARSSAPKVSGDVPPPSGFISLRGGMATLFDALASALGGAPGNVIRTHAKVTRIDRFGSQWSLGVENALSIVADHVALTGPAWGAAAFLRPHDAPLADLLEAIPYGSSATTFVAYPKSAVLRPLDATGYIVPRASRRHAIASTWISSKWPDRAPPGHVSIRVFFGESDVDRDDDALVAMTREELRDRIGIEAAPMLTHVSRFRRASPQPPVGHKETIRRVRARLAALGGVHLLGSAYDGVGISDCVRQANEAAGRISGRIG
jgi:oxygen-dependent protoporphyrinogen oxidase